MIIPKYKNPIAPVVATNGTKQGKHIMRFIK